MPETVHLKVASSCDADAFVEFLATRGLRAEITSANDHCELDVRFAEDPATRLHREFEDALAAWLEHRERPLIPVHPSADDYVLRPPGD